MSLAWGGPLKDFRPGPKKKIKTTHSYRPHRGGYQEAAAERVYFNVEGELINLLESIDKVGDFPTGPFRTKFYAEDDRMMPSESYMVLDYMGRPVGFSSLPLS